MKYIYLVLGFLFLGIGFLGAAIPLLPTVPFLLVASFFFGKSSKRLNDWLKSTNVYKKHINRLAKEKAMTLKAKVAILAPVTVMLITAAVFSKPVWARVIILFLLGLKYFYFIFKIKTIK